MIDGLKPYPTMKESGAPWLGVVPEHWEVMPLRRMTISRCDGPFGSGLKSTHYTHSGVRVVRLQNIGHAQFKNSNPAFISPAYYASLGDHSVESRDVIIAGLGDEHYPAGRACVAPASIVPAMVKADCFRFRLDDTRLNPDFAALLLTATAVASSAILSRGATRQRTNLQGTASRAICVPQLYEQAAIVRFLDHGNRKIRRYIRAKRKLISFLEEQKRTVIHQAVTRGLDPDVRLRPSGVEWLGDIPEHWEIRRNGRLFAQRNQTGFADLPILEVSLRTGVRVREFENGARKQVMSDRDKYKRAAKGDLAYNMMRMWQGAVGVAPVDGLVSPAYVVASPLSGVDVRYFASLFRTPAYMGEVDNHSRGIVKDRNRLYWEDFKQIFSPYPPLDEQEAIAKFIDARSASIANAVAQVEREIDLLNEYRSRLIADVVTGKLDVRAAAASLSDETGESDVPDDTCVDVDEDEELADDESVEADA